MGLENGNVKDGQLAASSAWSNDPKKFGAQRARLNLNRWPSGWTANVKDLSPWLQVNLNDPFIVTRVATQGYGGANDQWVESYRMSWKNGEGIWRNYSIPHRRLSTSKVQWRTKVINFCLVIPCLVKSRTTFCKLSRLPYEWVEYSNSYYLEIDQSSTHLWRSHYVLNNSLNLQNTDE